MSDALVTAASPARCAGCGTELGPRLLSCPSCHRLVHADALRALAADAEAATTAGDVSAALVAWRRALELLPADSRQHAAIAEKVAALSSGFDRGTAVPAGPAPGSRWARWLAPLGAFGAVLWKLKFLLGVALTKGKLLLIGLTKMSTLLSALASFGVYWAAWGWRFALGLVASMYVHEMGHVFELKRLGIRATAPMFVPGLGAFVRSEQYPVDPREDARVGLAGPLWGLYAAVATAAVAMLTGWASWAAVARSAALLNLFNLVPLGTLDGGRGFRSLSRTQRFLASSSIGLAWFATHESLLGLLFLVALGRAAVDPTTPAGDRGGLVRYAVLIAALSALAAPQLGLPLPS